MWWKHTGIAAACTHGSVLNEDTEDQCQRGPLQVRIEHQNNEKQTPRMFHHDSRGSIQHGGLFLGLQKIRFKPGGCQGVVVRLTGSSVRDKIQT